MSSTPVNPAAKNPDAWKANLAASALITTFSVVTIGSVLLGVTATTKAAMVAYGILGTVGTFLGAASITAWLDQSSQDVGKYVSNIGKHLQAVVPAITACVAKALCMAVVDGIKQGVTKRVSNTISGDNKQSE